MFDNWLIPLFAFLSGSLIPLVSKCYKFIVVRRKERARTVIIGLVNDVCVPQLTSLPFFSDYADLVYSDCNIGVLRCRTLSYALRHCDWVIANEGADVKVISPGDKQKIAEILNVNSVYFK